MGYDIELRQSLYFTLLEIPLAAKVQILASGVTSIAAMDETSFAVYDGFLFGWGSNDKGQLGLGDVEDRAAPTEISRLANPDTGLVGVGTKWITDPVQPPFQCPFAHKKAVKQVTRPSQNWRQRGRTHKTHKTHISPCVGS